MQQYLARVELHHGEPRDYEALIAQLAIVGFVGTIRASDGSADVLPTGTYVCPHTTRSLADAHAVVRHAASAIGRAAAIVIVESGAIRYSGLDPLAPGDPADT